MILHQAATNKYVSTVHQHILCGHNHFALSTSDLAQYRIITIHSISTIGGSTIFQKFEFDLVQLIHGAYHISKHSEGN